MTRRAYLIFSLFLFAGVILFFQFQESDNLSQFSDGPGEEETQPREDSRQVDFHPANPTRFYYPEGLRPQVEFWKKIFTEYTSKQAVIHDRRHVSIVYAVIDLTKQQVYSEKARRKAIRSSVKKYKRILRRLHTMNSENVHSLSDEEKRVFTMMKAVPGNYRFDRAGRNFRVQYGMKDSFQEAMVNSTRYLKEMEKIFEKQGLPVELTRIPFAESSFNEEAYSLAGAAGIWQFTRSTGKHYMRIDRAVDERKNPLKSTEAAAKLLSFYYNQLESWPLAITAYNHGAYGMKRAVRQTKSRDIETIINNYKSSTFGFSSRNFYVEFLAILEILEDYRQYFGEMEFLMPEEYDEFIPEDYIKMNTLLKHCSLDKDVIDRLNPELSSAVLSSRSFLPKSYPLKVPPGMKEELNKQYAMIASSEKQSSIDVTKIHRVTFGQSLSYIAQLYNTSVNAIIKANSIKDPDKLDKGQVLKIPTKA